MVRHFCRVYGRPKAYSLYPWRDRNPGPSPHVRRLGWEHSLSRYEHGKGWCCPICGDEWSLWVGPGGLLRWWSPARDAESGKQFNHGPDGGWWYSGYRVEADAAGTRCAHRRIKKIKAVSRARAPKKTVLLSRCRRCGRVVQWDSIGE